jgi:hypothetical protein
MSSLNYSPPVIKEEEEVCWTEKEALGLNIVVKEEKDAVFGVKKEGEITVTLKDEEVEIRDLSNTSKYRLKLVFNFGYSELARQYLFNGGP